jgi:glycosyltransferase involved in cell wall biosynthesis
MIIGIDGNEANVSKRVGISEYAYWLLHFFAEFAAKGKTPGVTFVIYLKQRPVKALPKETANWKYKIVGPGKFWTQFGLPLNLFLSKPRPDVFFSPTHYAPRFSPAPSVISVMDLSFLSFPEMFNKSDMYQLKNWTKYSVKKATKVLTISNSSRNDIIETYQVPEEKVLTIYPGIKQTVTLEPRVYAMNELKAKYGVSDKYVLFVGTLQPRKNIGRLIEAFSKVKKQASRSASDDVQLVVIGKRGWLYEEILAAPEKFGIEDSVKFLEGINDDELTVFYKHALVYVLPSLYEGFGLPVVEAMKHGCPVITSNISSLPEAGGDAAIYVDPENVDDIAKKITKVISDKDLRRELSEKGKKQAAKFNWETTAKETLKVLVDVAAKEK